MKVSELQTLFKSGVTRKLGDFTVEIPKLGTDELPLMGEMMELDTDENGVPKQGIEFMKVMKKITVVVLRKVVEDAKDDTELNLPIDYLEEFYSGIMEANKNAFEMSGLSKDKEALLKKLKDGSTAATGNQ